MQHQAINPKYQRALDRLYKADRAYCETVDSHQEKLDAMDPDSDKFYAAQSRFEDVQAAQLDYLTEHYIWDPELPKRELEAFAKSYEAFHGYTPYLV